MTSVFTWYEKVSMVLTILGIMCFAAFGVFMIADMMETNIELLAYLGIGTLVCFVLASLIILLQNKKEK